MNELIRQMVNLFAGKGLRVDRLEIEATDDGAVVTRKDTMQRWYCVGAVELFDMLATALWLVNPNAREPKRIVWG